MFVRSLALAALFLAACGGSETPTPEPADGEAASAPAAAPDAAPDAAPAAATGAVTCDTYADHFMDLMRKEAEAAGDNEFMTVEQQLEFVGAMVEGIREGCKQNDRLAEFDSVVGCFMAAQDASAAEACKGDPQHAAFDEYMKSLLMIEGGH